MVPRLRKGARGGDGRRQQGAAQEPGGLGAWAARRPRGAAREWRSGQEEGHPAKEK
jgi:hypothetical protein